MEHRSADGSGNARAGDPLDATDTAFPRTAPPDFAQGRWASEKVDVSRTPAPSDPRARRCRGAATRSDGAGQSGLIRSAGVFCAV